MKVDVGFPDRLFYCLSLESLALLVLSGGSAAMSDFSDLLGSSWLYLEFNWIFLKPFEPAWAYQIWFSLGFHLWLCRAANLGAFVR